MLAASDPSINIGNGIVVTLAALLLAAFFKLQVAQWRGAKRSDETVDVLDYRLECAELAERHCNRNFQILAGLCERQGVEVPAALYADPPLPKRPDPRARYVKTDGHQKDED